MEAKNKAWELLQTIESIYINDDNYDPEKTKKCALICVYEMIKENENIDLGWINSSEVGAELDRRAYYLREVQQEIKKL